MELSANRRYTSKLVLEDTTVVFQKMKGERVLTRSSKIPAKKQCCKGQITEVPADLGLQISHLTPYKCHPGFMYNVSHVQFCIAGPVILQVSPWCCFMARELYIATEELTWPRRAEKQQAWLEGRPKTVTKF